jgi:protein-disulfide isomerase
MKAIQMLALALLLGTAMLPALAATGGDEVVGYVGDKPITRAQLEKAAAGELSKVRQQEYEVLSSVLEQLINDELASMEAEARGISVDELVQTEVADKVKPVTDAEVDDFYQKNIARMQGRSREEADGAIRNYLDQQQRYVVSNALMTSLRAKANVRMLLDPPRAKVAIPAGEPARGPEDAAVTVVEFSDFQCPYCKRAHETVEQLVAAYGDKIRFVYRDYPLPNHPQAFPAARAARCAGEQDKYWEYHTSLMTVGGTLDDADLKKRAGDLALDVDAFSSCVESGRHDGAIRQSMQDGAVAGVTGTPAFLINGRLLSGAQPLAALQKVVDEELARAQQAN